MADVKITIDQAKLDAFVASKLAVGIPAGGQAMLSEAQALAPIDTGRLRDSLTLDESGRTATVSTDLPYALAAEYGTGRTPAQPYMRPALQKGLDDALKSMEE